MISCCVLRKKLVTILFFKLLPFLICFFIVMIVNQESLCSFFLANFLFFSFVLLVLLFSVYSQRCTCSLFGFCRNSRFLSFKLYAIIILVSSASVGVFRFFIRIFFLLLQIAQPPKATVSKIKEMIDQPLVKLQTIKKSSCCPWLLHGDCKCVWVCFCKCVFSAIQVNLYDVFVVFITLQQVEMLFRFGKKKEKQKTQN